MCRKMSIGSFRLTKELEESDLVNIVVATFSTRTHKEKEMKRISVSRHNGRKSIHPSNRFQEDAAEQVR